VNAGEEVAGRWSHLTQGSLKIDILYGNVLVRERKWQENGAV